jgi:hypothetical protein
MPLFLTPRLTFGCCVWVLVCVGGVCFSLNKATPSLFWLPLTADQAAAQQQRRAAQEAAQAAAAHAKGGRYPRDAARGGNATGDQAAARPRSSSRDRKDSRDERGQRSPARGPDQSRRGGSYGARDRRSSRSRDRGAYRR